MPRKKIFCSGVEGVGNHCFHFDVVGGGGFSLSQWFVAGEPALVPSGGAMVTKIIVSVG